jgi:hypothetical protein
VGTLFVLEGAAHVVQLAVVHGEIGLSNLQILVGVWACNDYGVRVKGVERNLEEWGTLRV